MTVYYANFIKAVLIIILENIGFTQCNKRNPTLLRAFLIMKKLAISPVDATSFITPFAF
jgi:hypothetical protein